jgi:hypothetical protein
MTGMNGADESADTSPSGSSGRPVSDRRSEFIPTPEQWQAIKWLFEDPVEEELPPSNLRYIRVR